MKFEIGDIVYNIRQSTGTTNRRGSSAIKAKSIGIVVDNRSRTLVEFERYRLASYFSDTSSLKHAMMRGDDIMYEDGTVCGVVSGEYIVDKDTGKRISHVSEYDAYGKHKNNLSLNIVTGIIVDEDDD